MRNNVASDKAPSKPPVSVDTAEFAARGTVEVRIADRLRELRRDKRLTLKQLSDVSGVSAAFLSRVENHRASLTIAGLERVARALGTPLAAFFQQDEASLPIAICRKGEGDRGVVSGRSGVAIQTLAAMKSGKFMEPFIAQVTTSPAEAAPKPHSGHEFDYVLEGECRLLFGKADIRLNEGDSVYYDASVPHAAVTVDGKACRLLVVVASRDYLFHGDLMKLLNDEE